MFLINKIRKAYDSGRIKFSDFTGTFRPFIICSIDEVSFDFLDTCKTTSELLNKTDVKHLCKKIEMNVKAISKYRPDVVKALNR